ncbi:MAG TPA: GNAT family N-acetyltransferase [Candidatus Dormibacteraeota bacterium]|nr:GNAT family N-acetyltransferase [Candidatus Dormibacteraeota bacterium]
MSLLRTRVELTDLRRVESRKLQPLLNEEAHCWIEQLRWDYAASLDLIRNFIDARSLPGYVAWQKGEPAGYGFYVIEERKGLIGGLFVSSRFSQTEVARLLIREMLGTMRFLPHLARVEAQLMPTGTDLDKVLAEEKFRLYPRQFMLLPLGPERTGPVQAPPGLRLEPWNDRWVQSASRLIRLAYENHVDGEINDQYRSDAGANRFLRNIVFLRGCGEFLPKASFVLAGPLSDTPVGVVLTSAVAPGVGHTTQICILPGYQGHGLGRQLLEASASALTRQGYTGLSLTVTSANRRAVSLYERIGFQTLRRFSAGVWKP